MVYAGACEVLRCRWCVREGVSVHLGDLLALLVHLEGGHGSDAGTLGNLKKNEEEGESGSDTVCANAVVLVIVWASAGDVLLVCP